MVYRKSTYKYIYGIWNVYMLYMYVYVYVYI